MATLIEQGRVGVRNKTNPPTATNSKCTVCVYLVPRLPWPAHGFWPRHAMSKPSGALEAPHCGANDGYPNRTRPGKGSQKNKPANRARIRSAPYAYTPSYAYPGRHEDFGLSTGFRSRVARWKPRIAEPTMATLIEQAWVGVCKFTNPETGTDSPHAAHIYPLPRLPSARYKIDLECRAHGFYTLRLLQCALWLCVLPAARPPDALWAAPHAA